MNFKLYIKESLKYILRSPYVIGRYIKEVDDLYNMSPEELKIYKEKHFLEIFRKAWTKSAYYRNLCIQNGVSSLDDIQRLEDIVKLPILTKDMLKAHGEELLTRDKRGLIKNHTSGTTGTPLMVYENWPALWREQAYLYCYRKRCGFTYGEPLVSLRGNLTRRDTSLKVHVSNTLFLSSYNINSRTAETYHRLIEQLHPKAIEGYPSSLYSLALVFRDKGLECHIPVAFTSSETIYGYQREVIESVFHTKIYDHYGTTERTISIEESFDHDGYFESPGYGIEEYRDDCIITTSLINEAFPLIRYITNDRISLKDNVRKSAEGFIVGDGIKSLDGRAGVFLIGKDGTRYSDSALTYVVKYIPGVRYIQFVQEVIGHIDVRIVSAFQVTQETKENLLGFIDKKMGLDNFDVSIKEINEEQLLKTKRGKLSLVINLINQK